MREIRAFLPRLIAIVLLMQTVLAPAHCLAHAAAAGFATVVCTEAGQRILHLTPDGDAAPELQPDSGFCAMCHGLPTAPHLAVPVRPTPAWIAVGDGWHVASAGFLPPRARAPPFDPTGPPARLS